MTSTAQFFNLATDRFKYLELTANLQHLERLFFKTFIYQTFYIKKMRNKSNHRIFFGPCDRTSHFVTKQRENEIASSKSICLFTTVTNHFKESVSKDQQIFLLVLLIYTFPRNLLI